MSSIFFARTDTTLGHSKLGLYMQNTNYPFMYNSCQRDAEGSSQQSERAQSCQSAGRDTAQRVIAQDPANTHSDTFRNTSTWRLYSFPARGGGLTAWWAGSCWRRSHRTKSWSYCCSDLCRKTRQDHICSLLEHRTEREQCGEGEDGALS